MDNSFESYSLAIIHRGKYYINVECFKAERRACRGAGQQVWAKGEASPEGTHYQAPGHRVAVIWVQYLGARDGT